MLLETFWIIAKYLTPMIFDISSNNSFFGHYFKAKNKSEICKFANLDLIMTGKDIFI